MLIVEIVLGLGRLGVRLVGLHALARQDQARQQILIHLACIVRIILPNPDSLKGNCSYSGPRFKCAWL